MSNQRREIKEAVLVALAQCADEAFFSAGFHRNSDSLDFHRTLPECMQAVEVCIEHTPKDNTAAAAAIYPWLTISIPTIDRIAHEMTGGNEALLMPGSKTLRQPIELTSPKGIGARWFVYQSDSVADAIQQFALYATQWLFCFLDEYSSPSGVIATYRSGDPRVLHDQAQILRVIAALITCGDESGANELLQQNFGRPAMRRRFAQVFDFLKSRSSA
jgi:hypothetical protein